MSERIKTTNKSPDKSSSESTFGRRSSDLPVPPIHDALIAYNAELKNIVNASTRTISDNLLTREVQLYERLLTLHDQLSCEIKEISDKIDAIEASKKVNMKVSTVTRGIWVLLGLSISISVIFFATHFDQMSKFFGISF